MALKQLDETLAGVTNIVSPVVLVGGSVRDALMGHEVTDYDLATPLDPDSVESQIRASGRRPYTVGKRYGTIGFRWQGRIVEVTTYRDERYRSRDRHPEVEFVDDIELDLARRDLTINAMAYDGSLIDPYGGEKDLSQGILRAVGDARARMEEDPLRILRVARFASRLGFSVEPGTVKGCQDAAHLIFDVSRQRWSAELDGLIMSEHLRHGFQTSIDIGILHEVLPLLSALLQNGSLDLDVLVSHVETAPIEERDLRWALLVFEISQALGNASITERARHLIFPLASSLSWSNRRTADTRSAVPDH